MTILANEFMHVIGENLNQIPYHDTSHLHYERQPVWPGVCGVANCIAIALQTVPTIAAFYHKVLPRVWVQNTHTRRLLLAKDKLCNVHSIINTSPFSGTIRRRSVQRDADKEHRQVPANHSAKCKTLWRLNGNKK